MGHCGVTNGCCTFCTFKNIKSPTNIYLNIGTKYICSPPTSYHYCLWKKGARLFEPKNAEANLVMAENVKQLSRLGFWIGLRDIDKNGVDYKLLSSGQLPSFTQWDQSPKIQPDNEWHRWVTMNKKFR